MASNFGGFPNIGQPGLPEIPWRQILIWGGGLGSVGGILLAVIWFFDVFTKFLWFGNLGSDCALPKPAT